MKYFWPNNSITKIELIDDDNETLIQDLTSLSNSNSITIEDISAEKHDWKIIVYYNDNLNTGTIESETVSFSFLETSGFRNIVIISSGILIILIVIIIIAIVIAKSLKKNK